MRIEAVVHEAWEGGFRADVHALPGCAGQGATMDELLANVREAIEGWLEAGETEPLAAPAREVVELTV